MILGNPSGAQTGEALASSPMDPFEMTVPADAGLPALVLSVPTGDDLDRITEICQDADIQEWTFVPRSYRRSDAEFFVEQVVAKGWSEGRELTWAIREADAGASPHLVGMLGITLSGPEDARTGARARHHDPCRRRPHRYGLRPEGPLEPVRAEVALRHP